MAKLQQGMPRDQAKTIHACHTISLKAPMYVTQLVSQTKTRNCLQLHPIFSNIHRYFYWDMQSYHSYCILCNWICIKIPEIHLVRFPFVTECYHSHKSDHEVRQGYHFPLCNPVMEKEDANCKTKENIQ